MDVPLDLCAVSDAFDLGKPVELTPVPGGLSNLMFRLRTDRGQFAIKQLTPAWPDTDWEGWLRAAFTFEVAAFDAGVPMPRPLPTRSGDVLAEVPNGDQPAHVRAHTWVDADPWVGPVTPELAEWVGRQLAIMHRLAVLPATHEPFAEQDGSGARAWPALVERIGDPDLRNRCQAIAAQVARVASWFRPDSVDAVMSHGDLDPKNLLIDTQGPMICDWDVAAPWVPRQELVRACLDMAYWERGVQPCWDVARACVRGYRAAGGTVLELSPGDAALHLLSSIDWLTLQVERAAGLRTEDGRRDEAQAAVPGLIDQWRDQVQAAERLPALLTDTRE